jgi:hypothetical protein
MLKLKPHLSVQQIAKKHRLDVSFIQKQLDMGEPIEHEHTKDHTLAMDIALQHLDEIPDYYTRLKKMEASAKKEHKKFKDVKESHEEQRYCPLCDKRESKAECSYGKKAWEDFSVKDHEYSMARSELSTVMNAVKRLQKKMGKGEGNIEAWVQSKITKAADYLDTAADYVASGEMEEACWVGYKQEGLKKKGKKMVPNCVPTNEAKTLGFEIKKSSGAGALTPDAAKQLGDKAVALQKKKAAAVSLPKLKEHRGIVADILNDIEEASKSGDSSLHDWFTKSKSSDGKPGWVQLGGKYAGKPCAKQPGQTTKPKCGSSKMSAEMSPEEEDSAARRKRREDPNPDRKGKAINVATEEYVNEDACKEKVKSRYKVWPSAYASGALVKCRKAGAGNWGNSSKNEEVVHERADTWHPDPEQDRKLGGPGANQRAREDRGQSTSAQTTPDYSNKLKPGENYMQFAKRKAAERMKEDVTIQDANGNTFAEVIDVIKPEPIKGFKQQVGEATRLQAETGNIIAVILNWRGKAYSIRMFFPQAGMPSRKDITTEIQKVYPGSQVLQYNVSTLQPGMPLIQVVNSKSKNYLLNNKTIGEETIEEEGPVLSVGRGEKLSVERGGGLTQKGRDRYNRATGSHLQAPVTGDVKPGSKAAKRRKNFCSRSRSWHGERGLAARKRWKC